MSLKVTAATRRVAIFKIIDELGFLRNGARVDVTQLMKAWAGVGLRSEDLSNGLNECLAAGILDFSATRYEARVGVTEAGREWFEAEQAGHPAGDLPDYAETLQAAAERYKTSDKNARPPFRDRRKD